MSTLNCATVIVLGMLQVNPSHATTATISPVVLEELRTHEQITVDVYATDLSQVSLPEDRILDTSGDAASVVLTEDEIRQLGRNPHVQYILPDITLAPTIAEAVDIIQADQVWQMQESGSYLTGAGQSLCVIDHSIDFSHPDLSAKNIAGGVFDCSAPSGCPFTDDIPIYNSHGTHIAGIIAANGAIHGIARDADLISVNVFIPGEQYTNSFKTKKAVEFCIEHREAYHITAITISLGSQSQYNECDESYPPLTAAINQAFDLGIPVTIGTGNAGSPSGISFPSCISSAISVGSSNNDDTIAAYTNYNDQVRLLAPGTQVYSTCLNQGYCTKSGTSMATPMVAASWVLLRQYLEATDQQLTPAEFELLMYYSGAPLFNISEPIHRINIFRGIWTHKIDVFSDLQINTQDLAVLLANWGGCTGTFCPGDLNHDGGVDHADVSVLLGFWSL